MEVVLGKLYIGNCAAQGRQIIVIRDPIVCPQATALIYTRDTRSKMQVNPRAAGTLDFPPPAGGLLRTTHPLYRLLGHVAIRSKRHSKERQNHDETPWVIF